jgi:hypothetical protein
VTGQDRIRKAPFDEASKARALVVDASRGMPARREAGVDDERQDCKCGTMIMDLELD